MYASKLTDVLAGEPQHEVRADGRELAEIFARRSALAPCGCYFAIIRSFAHVAGKRGATICTSEVPPTRAAAVDGEHPPNARVLKVVTTVRCR